MDDSIRTRLKPGARVRVTQQIAARHYAWANEVVGTVTDYEQKQTGSWYAHAKDDKLWLDRLTVRKDDGEMTMLNLDEFSHIEILDPQPAGAAGAAAEGKKNESDLPL